MAAPGVRPSMRSAPTRVLPAILHSASRFIDLATMSTAVAKGAALLARIKRRFTTLLAAALLMLAGCISSVDVGGSKLAYTRAGVPENWDVEAILGSASVAVSSLVGTGQR